MVDDLQPPVARLARRVRHVVDPVGAVDALEDLLPEALDADLDPRHSGVEEVGEDPAVAVVRSGLHGQADETVRGELVGRRGFRDRGRRRAIEALEDPPDDRIPVTLRTGRERSAHHDRLDLARRVADRSEDLETVLGDPTRVPPELGAPQGARLLAGVALRTSELDPARTVRATAVGTGRRRGHHGHDRNTGERARRLPPDADRGPLHLGQGGHPIYVRGDGTGTPLGDLPLVDRRGRARGRGVPVRVAQSGSHWRVSPVST